MIRHNTGNGVHIYMHVAMAADSQLLWGWLGCAAVVDPWSKGDDTEMPIPVCARTCSLASASTSLRLRGKEGAHGSAAVALDTTPDAYMV